jgi:hypothetical protein
MKDFLKELLREFFLRTDLIKMIVALTILRVFYLMATKLIHEAIPQENREIVIHMLGIIEGVIGTLATFYFGSSKGSQNKDKLLAESNPNKTA